jgi:hypothetical protein
MTVTRLPGEEIVLAGIADLGCREATVAALLVSIGAPRLGRLGIEVPAVFDRPEERLYELLAAEDQASAHGRYNALVRLLVSFERAAGCLTG